MAYILHHRKDHPFPGGHNFVFLNVSINKKPFFLSEVVTFKKAPNQRIKGFDVSMKGNTPACFPNVNSEYFLEIT